MKRIVSATLSTLIFCLLAGSAGCKNDDDATEDVSQAEGIARSEAPRDTNPNTTDMDVLAVAQGNTDLALKLFPSFGADANALFSPYSISLASALAAAGAKGATLSGIEQAMSFPFAQQRLNPAFNKLDALLASKTTGEILPDGRQTPQMNVVNDLWGQEGHPFLPSYLDTLAVNFGTGVHVVDFINAPEPARQTINAWVEDNTNGKIKDLLPLGVVSSDTRLVLTNAIWFKANWASAFGTAPDTAFFNRDGSQADVPFMKKWTTLPYAVGDGFRAVDIPYLEERLSMLVIMPDAGTFDSFVSTLSPAGLQGVIDLLDNQYVDLAMPKFEFTSSQNLVGALSAGGMSDAFQCGVADFSGIDGNRDLCISGAEHKAFIAVDEQGTEAAAATGLSVGITSVPEAPKVAVTFDHPFLFFIRDRETGLILMMGKIVKLT